MAEISRLSGTQSAASSSIGGIGGADRRVASSRQPVADAEGVGQATGRPVEKQWIHIDGRRFDLNAPRGTYLNILV